MYRLSFLGIFSIIFLLGSCKKDQLKFGSVKKIESHSDADRLNKVIFYNDTLGFIIGGQRFDNANILTTHDGGFTWQPSSFPISGKGVYGIGITPTGGIYTCGYDGKLLYSLDTGKNWKFTQMDYYAFTGLAFTNPNNGIIVGGISFSEGQIIYVDAVGTVTRRIPYTYQLNAIKMVTPQTGYICGFGAVLKTTDGGVTWVLLDIKGDNFMGMEVRGDDIWLCGQNGSIYHSANAGYSWVRQRNGDNFALKHYHLNSILFKDAQNGWAVGEDGLVIHTDDGGYHWLEYQQFTTHHLYGLGLCPNGDLIVTGEKGTIYRLGN